MTTKGPGESKQNLPSPKSKNKASLRDIWEIRITKSALKELEKVPFDFQRAGARSIAFKTTTNSNLFG